MTQSEHPFKGGPPLLLLLLGLLASCGGTSASIVPHSCSWYQRACKDCMDSLPRRTYSAGEDRASCPPCGRVDEACAAPPAGLHAWPDKTTDAAEPEPGVAAPEADPAGDLPSEDASQPEAGE